MLIHFIFGILFLSLFVFGQESKNVYFIGNSYTATGNIPNLIKQIANSSGDELIYTAHTPGGATLQQHASNPTVANTIQKGNWNYVVLQEQSQLPSFPDEQFNTMVLPFAEQINSLIKEHNPCAETTFHMTWGRKNGDSQNCPGWPPVCAYEGMDDLINQRYRLMAELNQGIISPVGAVWRYIRTNHPTIELYSSDGSHPSTVGSMAAAYTFYTVFYKKSPYEASYDHGLPQETVSILKDAVQQIVFNSMDEWHLWDSLPQADFDYSVSNLEVEFTDTSTESDSYTWDFGDGLNSTEQNPIHIYSETGIYTVKLQIEKCGEFDFIEQIVDLSAMAVSELHSSKLTFYPNPAKDLLVLISEKPVQGLIIYSKSGQSIYPKFIQVNNRISVDVRNLISGSYFLVLKTDEKSFQIQFLKK